MSKKPRADGDAVEFDVQEAVEQIIEQLHNELTAAGTFPAGEAPRKVEIGKSAPGATRQVTDRVQSYGLKPLRENELKSVYALFAWVANEQGAAEETVKSITEVHFGVNDVKKLQQKDYDEVIKFLVDLRIDEMKQ